MRYTDCAADALPAPARYYPFESGRYEVGPGLLRLGTDCGNGALDAHVFQLDTAWARYRAAKLAARSEELSKYVCQADFSPRLEARLIEWALQRLQAEHRSLFELCDEGGVTALRCLLSGERLVFSPDWTLLEAHLPRALEPPYASAFDALACQLQDDLAVVELDAEGGDRLTALHLCCPNHWAPRAKIGRPFGAVHAPVPGIERVSRNAPALLAMLAEHGPFVRFAWGLAADERLNHHPDPPPGADPYAWQGRRFDPRQPSLHLRVERQVTVGFPEQPAFLFTIRTYFEDVTRLPQARLAQLHQAISTMSPESLRYKGIAGTREAILQWLRALGA